MIIFAIVSALSRNVLAKAMSTLERIFSLVVQFRAVPKATRLTG
jgi:hypothetical protein